MEFDKNLTSLIFSGLLGLLPAWLFSYWYSIKMALPSLKENGFGSGSNFFGSKHYHLSIFIQNELRYFTYFLPFKPSKGVFLPVFGKEVMERNTAYQCSARLLEESGRFISKLWWLDDKKATEKIDIKSGEFAKLMLFLRKNPRSGEYFVYKPIAIDTAIPELSDVSKFNKPLNFIIEISDKHDNHKFQFPINVYVGYDGSLSYDSQGKSGPF